MRHEKTIEKRQDRGFLCLECDEPFYHVSEEKPVCPKCGASGEKWITPLAMVEDEDEHRGSGTSGAR